MTSPGTAYSYNYVGARLTSTQDEWVFASHPTPPSGWDLANAGSIYNYDSRGNVTLVSTETPVWAYVGSPDPYDEAEMVANHKTYGRSYYSAGFYPVFADG